MPKDNEGIVSRYTHTYGYAYVLTNVRLAIGFPIDRLKTQLQAETNLPAYRVTLNTLEGGWKALYAGYGPALLRENIKPVYRTYLITGFPQKMDNMVYQPCHLPPIVQAASSSAMATSLDLTASTPLEVMKVQKMVHSDRSLLSIFKEQMKTEGAWGFFSGYRASFLKSYPAWFNLFLMKQVIKHNEKDETKQVSFTRLAGYSVLSAAPLTLATTPFDVIKTRQQVSSGETMQSVGLFKTANKIVQQDGWLKLLRGFTPRLAHRFLSVFTGLVVMHVHENHLDSPSHSM